MIGGECSGRKRIGKPGCEIRQWASESQNQTNLAYVRFRGNEQLSPPRGIGNTGSLGLDDLRY